MSRRTAPFLIGFAVVALAALAGLWRIEQLRRDGRRAASASNTFIVIAQEAIDELRIAQAASAAGSTHADWTARGTAALVGLDSALGSLSATTSTPEAKPHYDTAIGLATQVRNADKKARELLTAGQTSQAADTIFQEGSETAKMLSAELASARDAELAGFEHAAAKLGYIELVIVGVSLGIGLVLLVIAMRGTEGAPETTTAPDQLDLHDVASDLPAKPAAPASAPGPEPFANPFTAPTVDLSGAAALCVDLGRIVDGRDLPGLMARAAGVLEAKGLVLWVSEGGGTSLRPSVAHGYPERVLQRMGTLPVDGDNVTSLAFRTKQPQTLRSSVDGFGALAVPLLTGQGCVGVLAAEMQGAKPGDARFDIARMIAAQLSTLVDPLNGR